MNISYLPLHRPKILLSDLTFGIWNNNVLDSLKTELSNYLGEFTVLTGSGRVAIKIALTSLGIGSNDEVIIPGFICSSVGEAVLETGATPVLATSEGQCQHRCFINRNLNYTTYKGNNYGSYFRYSSPN